MGRHVCEVTLAISYNRIKVRPLHHTHPTHLHHTTETRERERENQLDSVVALTEFVYSVTEFLCDDWKGHLDAVNGFPYRVVPFNQFSLSLSLSLCRDFFLFSFFFWLFVYRVFTVRATDGGYHTGEMQKKKQTNKKTKKMAARPPFCFGFLLQMKVEMFFFW